MLSSVCVRQRHLALDGVNAMRGWTCDMAISPASAGERV
jgi:hypothetical protein